MDTTRGLEPFLALSDHEITVMVLEYACTRSGRQLIASYTCDWVARLRAFNGLIAEIEEKFTQLRDENLRLSAENHRLRRLFGEG